MKLEQILKKNTFHNKCHKVFNVNLTSELKYQTFYPAIIIYKPHTIYIIGQKFGIAMFETSNHNHKPMEFTMNVINFSKHKKWNSI